MYVYRHLLFEDNKHKTDRMGGMAEKREAIWFQLDKKQF